LHAKKCGNVSGAKSSHLALFSTFLASAVLEPEKVVKIRPNYLSIVLTGNERNCATNCIGMFQAPNILIQAKFSTLGAPVMPGLGKVVKIQPKHFFVVLIGNDKICTPKSVGMFRALNRVIGAVFNFSCSGGVRALKSREKLSEIVFTHKDEKRQEMRNE